MARKISFENSDLKFEICNDFFISSPLQLSSVEQAAARGYYVCYLIAMYKNLKLAV